MSGVYHLEITESEETLKPLLRQPKSATNRDRVHLLYLLKSSQAATMQQATTWPGRHRVTVQNWARCYRDGGLGQLLTHVPHTGDKSTLPDGAETALRKVVRPKSDQQNPAALEAYQKTG